MTGAIYPYAVLTGLVLLVLTGLLVGALVVGWWGVRKAKAAGKWCPDCGRWDEPVEILIHRIREHERKE